MKYYSLSIYFRILTDIFYRRRVKIIPPGYFPAASSGLVRQRPPTSHADMPERDAS
jgi:hypothetical protein